MTETILQAGKFRQTLLEIAEDLPAYQRAQLLDYAITLKKRQLGTGNSLPIGEDADREEHDWGKLAIRSLAKEWDTADEDEAWASLQKGT